MSAIELQFRLVGAQETRIALLKVPDAARQRLFYVIQGIGFSLRALIQNTKLSGQVLNRRSGQLWDSLYVLMFSDSHGSVARIGTNLVYGRFWELGFAGVESVRGYFRSVRSGDVRMHMNGRHRLVAEGIGYVRPHERVVNEAPRSYLRTGLEDMAPDIPDLVGGAMRGVLI